MEKGSRGKKLVKDLKTLGKRSFHRLGTVAGDELQKQLRIGAQDKKKKLEMERKKKETSIRADILRDLKAKGRLRRKKR